MRLTVLAILAGFALTALATPAAAQWRPYISHPLGFAFAAPGPMKVEKGTYEAPVAGRRQTTTYSFTDANIDYKVVFMTMRDVARTSASLLGEAQYGFQDGKKMLMDAFGRVDRQFGRKLTVDLPNNGGRSMGAFYFINGRIISLQATVLPANGDYETPETGRFIDSITFYTVRADDDAIEVPPPG